MKPIIIVAAIAILIAAAAGVILLSGSNPDNDKPEPPPPVDLSGSVSGTASQWAYFGGDMNSFGVTDSVTPVAEKDIKLLWKVNDPVDAGSMTWKTPSSAICVGDKCYYYRGSDSSLYCAELATGKTVAKASCPSSSVYNMAVGYGDGKVFVCTLINQNTVLRAFDSETLRPLFVSEPVSRGEVQGPVVYYDGKVFFGTYLGDYACIYADDVDPTREDETADTAWILKADGWYNASPAFFGDRLVIVQRGFETLGATAYMIDAGSGAIIDTVSFDREYSSSGAAFYEGRVYIPLNKVIDRTIENPDENTPEHLSIHSFAVGADGFARSSEKIWESGCSWGGTQSVPVIWNGTLYIGGGGKVLGSDEPFWILDLEKDGTMKTRKSLDYLKTKSTASVTTAYSSGSNGYAVYIYIIEYGHVNQGEPADSASGYSDVFVIKDSKTEGTETAVRFRPVPEQFAFQSFSVSEGGYLLIRNDSTLFCYGPGSGYAPSDLVNAIDRFVSMSENGHTSYADFQRIVSRYYDMSESQRKQVSNFDKLADHCATVTLDLGQEKKTVTVPRGACAVLPEIPVPAGKILTGWTSGGKQWIPYLDAVTGDMTAVPVFEDCVTVTADPGNGDRISTVISYKGGILPYISEPAREGYAFGGWFSGDKEYVPMRTVVNADTSLAAKWLKISVLSFDSDGGSDVTGEYTAVYTRPLGDLPQVVRSGYSFNGWYYGDVLYTSETVYMFEEGITLKAGWTENGTSVLDNGKGLTVSGKIAGDTKLTVSKGNPNGSTVKSVSETCMNDHGVPADCILITIKGDGIDSGLPFRITVKAAGAPDGPADVYYYLGGVQKTQGTVENGTLAFEAYGSSVYGGVQIVFGVQTGYGILDCV